MNWLEKFQDKNVVLDTNVKSSWKSMFKKLKKDKRYDNIIKSLSDEVKNGNNMFPYPDLVFHAFNLTSFRKLKVVILGQDPYFNIHNNIPEATGLAFSVPKEIKIPSSLINIYKNLIKFKHIEEFPEHGNLDEWAKQGILLLNTSLTVKEGSQNKNCHQNIWSWFSDEIIKYISDNKEGIVFVLWGSNALNKSSLIDTKKHHITASSHPSGLSVNSTLRQYDAFCNTDHFGFINEKMKKQKIGEIDFNV